MKFRLFYKMSILFIVSDIKKGVDHCYKEFGIPDAHVIMRDRAFLKYPHGETVEMRTPESLVDFEIKDREYDLFLTEEGMRLSTFQGMTLVRMVRFSSHLFDNMTIAVIKKER